MTEKGSIVYDGYAAFYIILLQKESNKSKASQPVKQLNQKFNYFTVSVRQG